MAGGWTRAYRSTWLAEAQGLGRDGRCSARGAGRFPQGEKGFSSGAQAQDGEVAQPRGLRHFRGNAICRVLRPTPLVATEVDERAGAEKVQHGESINRRGLGQQPQARVCEFERGFVMSQEQRSPHFAVDAPDLVPERTGCGSPFPNLGPESSGQLEFASKVSRAGSNGRALFPQVRVANPIAHGHEGLEVVACGPFAKTQAADGGPGHDPRGSDWIIEAGAGLSGAAMIGPGQSAYGDEAQHVAHVGADQPELRRGAHPLGKIEGCHQRVDDR